MDEDYPILRHANPGASLRAGVGMDLDPRFAPKPVPVDEAVYYDPERVDIAAPVAGTEKF